MSWKEVKLGELYTAYNGLSKSKKFFGTGDPFLTFSTVFNNYFLPRKLTEYVQSTIQEQQNYSICRGDVFITRTSEKSDELGLSCVALKDYPKATYNGFTKRLRPINPDCVVPEYIGYYMRMPAFRQEFQAFSTMTTRASLRNDDLLGLTVLLPNIKTQERIAGILRHYDFLIENNQKQIKLLEEAAQRLYKEWFIDLRFPGHENVEIVDGVPEGWNIRPFKEVFSYVRGKSYKSSELSESEGVLLVNLKNINAFGGYKRNAEKRYLGTYKADQGLDAGDIVMGVTDMTQERRLVGHVAIVPDLGENMTLSMDLIKLIPKSVTRGYLYSAMRFGRYSEQISPFANGVNVLHLKPESIMNMIMVVPSRDILERYENIFESYREKIELLEKQSNYLTEARNRLLPKLMSGEIEV